MTALRSWVRFRVQETRSFALSYRLSRRLRRAVQERRERYAGQDLGYDTERVAGRTLPDVVDELDRRGFCVLEDVFPADGLLEVAAELRRAQDEGRVLSIGPDGEVPPATEEAEVTRLANLTFARRPFVDCPSALRYAFSDEIVDLARAAYGCPPCLTAGKVMRTYVNDLPRKGFYWFHADSQAARIVKFFLYLHDVDDDAGPFCFVEGSHRGLPRSLRGKLFLTDEEVERHYGRAAMHRITARAGSLILANTAGLHRASKPTGKERHALLVATGVHPWPGRPVHLRASDLEGRPAKVRALADLAEIV